jgi:hypothetical protein
VSQQQRAIVIPEDARVTTVIRINPQHLQQYFDSIRSPQHVISYAEAAGFRLDEWERELLEKAWASVALGTTPLMEVFPIAHPEAFRNSYILEVVMHIENTRSLFEKMHLKCLELEGRWADIVKLGEAEKYAAEDRQCEALLEYGPRVATILTLYILEFVHRKAQFSHKVQAQPNSALAKAGILTD